MTTKYEIRVLSNDEFDILPYSGARESLGLADEKRGVAFIRETGVKDIDQNTIEHEFDELLQKVSPHEVDGIRYKKLSDVFDNPFTRQVVNLLSIIPSPAQPFAIGANVGLTGRDIHERGFQPLDTLSLLPTAIGAFKGFNAPAKTGLGRFRNAAKGAFGISPSAPSSQFNSSSSGFPLSSRDIEPVGSNFGKGVSNFGKSGAPTTSFGNLNFDIPNYKPVGGFGNLSAPSKSQLSVTNALKDVGKQVATDLATSTLTRSLQPQRNLPVSNGTNTGVLDRFSPLNPSNAQPRDFISQDDISEAFLNLDKNISIQSFLTKQRFRGQSRDENSALNNALNNISQSRKTGQQQIVSEANSFNERQRKSALRTDIMKLNNLSDQQFDTFLEEARKPDAHPNLKKVFAEFI